MKIQAAITVPESSRPEIHTIELEDPRDDEIIVRVVAAGVCHTDLSCASPHGWVPKPIVLGHEGAGIVERVGAKVVKVQPGDHVVMSLNTCGRCPQCTAGDATYCAETTTLNFGGVRLDGSTPLSREGEKLHGNFFGQSSFSTYALCNERNAIKVPKDLPLEILAPLGCGVQTGAGSVLNAFKLQAGQTIAVFGCGGVGLSAVMAARVAGASRIIAIDPLAHRLAVAKELGATDVLDPTAEDAKDAILRLTGHGVDFAFDTTGVPAAIQAGIEALAPLGTFGFVAGGEIKLDLGQLMRGGKKLKGIIEGEAVSDLFIPMLAELYRQGRFPLDKMIKFYDFHDIEAAFADSASGATIKPVLRFGA